MITYFIQIWSRRKWLLLSALLLSASGSVSLIMALPDLYRSSTTILLGQDAIAGSFVSSGTNSQLDQRLHVIRQELLSRDQLMTLIERFDLYSELRLLVPVEPLLARMRKDILISQSTTSAVSMQRGQPAPMEVRISYQGWSPEQVADVTNALAETYREKYENIRFGQANRTTEFLREQLDEVEARLQTREQQINEFRAANLGQLPEQENLNLASLERLNTDLRLNEERQIQLMNRRNEIQSSVFGTVAGVTGETRLDMLRREMSVMQSRFNVSHPGMIRLQEEIRSLERSLSQADPADMSPGESNTAPSSASYQSSTVPEELRRLRNEENSIRSSITAIQKRLQLTPEVDQTLSQLSNAYNTIREEYLALQRRYQDARLAQSLESQQTQQFQVLEMARPADYAFGPDRFRLLIMAILLTIGGLAGLAFFAEQFNHTFRQPADLRSFTSVPVLTTISHMNTRLERFGQTIKAIAFVVVLATVTIGMSTYLYDKGQTAKGIVWLVVGNNA